MKYFATLALAALLAMNVAAQSNSTGNGTDTGSGDDTDADTDRLHGWCQCVTIGAAVIDARATVAACIMLPSNVGAKYDPNAQRCFTQGSRIDGDTFQVYCRNVSSNKDNSRCSQGGGASGRRNEIPGSSNASGHERLRWPP